MEHYLYTNKGNREINEDYAEVFETEMGTFYILADGLGGHGFGEIASKEAALEVKRIATANTEKAIETLFEMAFIAANTKMGELQNQVGNDSYFKTTMVMLCIRKNEFIWGHIGDSRLYHFEEHKLIERSMDHSVPQMLVNAGKIKESKIRCHPDRSRLLKVLGADQDTVSPYISTVMPLTEDSEFLLCSDGFWECIKEKKMEKLLKKTESSEEWMNSMIEVIEKDRTIKNKDNYTAIAVRQRSEK